MSNIILKSSFDGEIVNYYDKFFLGEGVREEIDYLVKMIALYSNEKAKSIIDIGCGTGLHANEFTSHFDNILGLDISKDMIDFAKNKYEHNKVEYKCADIRTYNSSTTYDVAVALSHVIGYQIENSSVESMLLSINKLLLPKGILILNFYNEPALFLGRLRSRLKKVQSETSIISRFSNAQVYSDDNVLLLDYYYIIEDEEKEKPISIELNFPSRHSRIKPV